MREENMFGLSNVVERKNLTLPYFPEILPFLLKDRKLRHYNITLYEGFNACKWNAGRTDTKGLVLTDKIVQRFNSMSIRISSTFSNNIIDTQDKIGNEILTTLSQTDIRNEIILSNERLRCLIKEKYPLLDIKFSITGHTNITEFYQKRKWNKAKVFKYYLDLFQKYDIVVIHSELAIKRWFIEFLKKFDLLKKAEVIMNIIKGCSFCPMHKEHYELISAVNRGDIVNPSVMGCILPEPPTGFVDSYFKDPTKKFLVHQFKNLKLEGRTLKTFKAFYDLNAINFKWLKENR